MAPRVLIADDQADVLEALRLILKPEGYQVEMASSPAGVLAAIERREFDVVLIDLNYTRDTTSGREGLDLLTQIQSIDGTLPVVVMTAWGSVEVAVEAMRRGARDFVQKPWENSRVIAIVRNQIALSRALRTGQRLEAENKMLRSGLNENPTDGPRMIADSPAMLPVLRLIRDVGPSDANILITGEPGTGKELVAQALHAVSGRSGKRLVTVNTGGLPEGVFESELFGHVKGAFTDAKQDRIGRFELADGGTLFLDEIANITPSQQSRLLRVLQTGEMERVGSSRTIRVDARVLSATNADLHDEVSAGRFRADLLFRLNAIEIHLPPLRDRREDIPILANHFVGSYAHRYRKKIAGFDSAAVQSMMDHAWPGNIRELAHAIERAVLLAQGEQIAVADLGLRQGKKSELRLEDMSLEQVEDALIRKALARYAGNVSHAAKALGLSRSALYRRLERHRPA
jgi:DNA-binding NtrC family response regulator